MEVLSGYKPETHSFHTFNHYRYLLIARYYIYLARNKFETPKPEVFIVLLEIKIQSKKKLQYKTELLTNTEISGPPCAFLISVDLW